MYKIYINETPLILSTTEEKDRFGEAGEWRLLAPYPGKPKFLYHYIDLLEKNDRYEWVVLYHRDIARLWADFKGQFRCIEAAGGVVETPDGKVLFIFRRGHWDLPKGKIDPGETVAQAALREVAEETGLARMQLGDPLGQTYHMYREEKKGRVLKITHWFRMSAPESALVPQQEEDIEQAVWLPPLELLDRPGKVYKNIMDILDKAGKLR